jgi:quinol monooxygenase YgiN
MLKVALALVVLTTVVGAQQSAPPPAPGPRFAVAYVEVMPSARKTLMTAVAAYREASRREDGYEQIELFAQPERPGHFVVIETWRDPQAFAAHGAAPHVKQFRDSLEPIRVSGYDERPYRALSVAPRPAAVPGPAVHFVAHVDIGGQQANVPAMLTQFAEESRKEQGALRVDVLQNTVRQNHFTVVETWASRAAQEAHAAAAHTKRYRDVLQPISGSPLDERLVQAIP